MKNASIFAVTKAFGGEVQGVRVDEQGEVVNDLILYEDDVNQYGYVQSDVFLSNGVEIQLELQNGKLSGCWEHAVTGESGEMSIRGFETSDVIRYIKEVYNKL